MDHLHLRYPKLQTVAFSKILLELSHQARSSNQGEIWFDLSRSEFVTPFGITLLAATIMECLRQGKICKYIAPTDKKLKKFFTTIGFDSYFQLQKHDDYPIFRSNIQLKRLDVIDPLISSNITELMSQEITMTEEVKYSLEVSLMELMTNVFDHSKSQIGCYVCAQCYPVKKRIRLSVVDFGIGIKASLNKSPKWSHLSDHHEAIRKAVLEGVTSRPGVAAGLGLAHLQRFLRVNRGDMIIVSGYGKVAWKHQERKALDQKMARPLSGTSINLIVNYDKDALYFLKSEAEAIL